MSYAAHLSIEVAGRGAQAWGLMDMAVQGFFDGMERRRLDDLDATQRLIAEVALARRAAAAALAEAERLRDENARLRGDLRSAQTGMISERARADRLDGSLRRLIGAVQASRAA